MKDSLTNVSASSKQILKSVAPLLIVLVLFLIVGKFGLSQVSSIRNQIKSAEKTQSGLSDKLKTLRSISQTAQQDSDMALFALPKSNPALQVISQIKNLAASNLLLLQNVKATPLVGDSSDISSVTVSFEATGPRGQIIAFLKGIDTLAPVMFVEKMDITPTVGDQNTVNVFVKSYYAPLPKTIPTVTQTITDLSPTEKELLSQISKLTQPTFSESVISTSSGVNSNPFGQ